MVRKIYNAYQDSLSGLSREVWMLSFALFINRCGSMVLAFLTLYMTNKLGFSVAGAGLIFSIYGIGAICGAYASGRLVDLMGPVRIQIFCLFVSAPLYMLVPVFNSFLGVAAAVFLLSLFSEAVRPANATAVALFSTPEMTTRAFGLQRLAVNLGMSFGPAIGGLLAEIDYYWLFVVDAITTLLGGIVLLWQFGLKRQTGVTESVDPAAAEEETEAALFKGGRAQSLSPLRDRFFVAFLGLILLCALVFFQFNAIYPKYLEDHYNLTPRWIGFVFAVNTVMVVLFEMLLLNRARHWSLLRTIGWGCFLTCLGFGLLPFGSSFGFLIGTMIILTIGEMLSAPLCSSFVATRARTRNQGRSQGMYMGWHTMTYALAAVLAPAIGGTIYEFNKDAFWYLAFLIGIMTLGGFYWLSHLNHSKQVSR